MLHQMKYFWYYIIAWKGWNLQIFKDVKMPKKCKMLQIATKLCKIADKLYKLNEILCHGPMKMLWKQADLHKNSIIFHLLKTIAWT